MQFVIFIILRAMYYKSPQALMSWRYRASSALSRSLAPLPRRRRSPHACSGVLLEGALVFSGVPSSEPAIVHIVLLFWDAVQQCSTGAAAADYCRLLEHLALEVPAQQC